MFFLHLDPNAIPGIASAFVAALDFRKPPMRDAAAASSTEMMRFQQRRFRSASGGDGTWPDLSPYTKKRRAKKQAGAQAGWKRGKIARAVASVHFPILIDTETMERGLFEQGGPGHFQRMTADTVEEGVEGGTHPNFPGGVGVLASINHYGLGHVPARTVMADPGGADLAIILSPLEAGVAAAAMNLGSYGQATGAA